MKRHFLEIAFSAATMTAGIFVCAISPSIAHAQSAKAAPMPSLKEPALDNVAAPVALYPDALLAQVLMASTYPLDVAEAARWAARHPSPSGSEIAGQPWEASVKALLPFAPVLDFLDRQKSWTRQLAAAVIKQPETLLRTIQALRQRAYGNGSLPPGIDSGRHQQVQLQDRIVTIEPADKRTLYVPYYDPAKVYGAASSSMLPPEYWAAQPYAAQQAKTDGVVFSLGVDLPDRAFYDARIDWRANRLLTRRIEVGANGAASGPMPWKHNPQYRKRKHTAGSAVNGGNAGHGYSVSTDSPPDSPNTVSTRDAGGAPQAPGGYRISTQPRR